VIDRPIERHALGEIDMGGWDIRKTLRLALKSNPVIWEWLQSPIVYQKISEDIATTLRDGIASCYSPVAACHHYLAICRGTMERELGGTEVKIKKYFYMLRPILAASWIERFKTVPPMEFEPLRAMLDGRNEINSAVEDLLEQKRSTDERVPIPRVKEVDGFLESELSRLTDAASRLPAALRHGNVPDHLLRSLIGFDPARIP
jgi:predicted nucleotidyltransferase